MDNFFILESVGYPRSGNHFLNHALRLMYYPDFQTKIVSHDYNKLNTEFVFVPFRNPIDSIPSFDKLKEKLNIDRERLLDRSTDMDVEQYIKFYSYTVQYQYHTILLDFDIFTKDLTYIARKIKAAKDIDVVNEVTVDDVKASMIEAGRSGNLPGGLERASDETKNAVINHPRFAECVNLYQQMKELAQ